MPPLYSVCVVCCDNLDWTDTVRPPLTAVLALDIFNHPSEWVYACPRHAFDVMRWERMVESVRAPLVAMNQVFRQLPAQQLAALSAIFGHVEHCFLCGQVADPNLTHRRVIHDMLSENPHVYVLYACPAHRALFDSLPWWPCKRYQEHLCHQMQRVRRHVRRHEKSDEKNVAQ